MQTVKPEGEKSRTAKIIGTVITLAAAIVLILLSTKIVPAGCTGVVVTMGKVSSNIYQEGFHFKLPFIQQVEIISNKIQVYTVDANAVSKDLQSISSSVAVNYRVNLNASADIYKNVGKNYQTVLLMPLLQESVKAVTAQYTAEQLITERSNVGEQIQTILTQKLGEYGIYIEKFNIVNFDFSPEFNAAIEAKQVAEQNLIKTRTEQQQAIVIAEAEAQKKIIAAEADADAILKKANAEAEANRKLRESIDDIILKYAQIDKWDGQLPKVTGSDGNLIDIGIGE
ncbi:MAG: prohibitin family protein [Oscillospiraceae bacterium]|jgi:regulator of protease activity HflC (stomatin/prohibitin superfamily)|nr:prohibitin family protein [Oscillospiraceae bacterium]